MHFAYTIYYNALTILKMYSDFISLFHINWLIFKKEIDCVFCEVGTESSCYLTNFRLQHKAALWLRRCMCTWILKLETRFQFHISPCEICGGHSGTVAGFPPSTSISPVSIIPPNVCIHIYLNTTVIRRKSGHMMEPSAVKILTTTK
jgi:hypothetical protein